MPIFRASRRSGRIWRGLASRCGVADYGAPATSHLSLWGVMQIFDNYLLGWVPSAKMVDDQIGGG